MASITSSSTYQGPIEGNSSSSSMTDYMGKRIRGNDLKGHDVMKRQRFMQNSSNPKARERAASIVSNPPKPDNNRVSDIRDFIQEQRKIINSFRSQPWPMKLKIEALKNYKENISHYLPHLTAIDTFREKSSRAVIKQKQRFKRFTDLFIVWRSIIKKIEGNFGTSVGSYFRLLRWLCVLNFGLFTLTFTLIVVPQLVAGKGLPVPDYVRGNLSAFSYVFDGEGYLFEYSILFIGYYDSGQNETYVGPPHNPNPYIGVGYKLPLAYLLVTVAMFVISAGAILYSIAKKYKLVQRSKVGGAKHYTFAWKVFANWDYAITDPKRVKIKMRQQGISLKEALFEVSKEEDTTTKAKFKKWALHMVTNAIVTILLFGSGYAIFVAADNTSTIGIGTTDFNLKNIGVNTLIDFIRSFQLQIVILLRNFLIPLLFKFIALHEKFHPRTALKLRLLRLFVLYFSSLYVVMISLFILSRNCGNQPAEANCRCWETNVGQELYKLTLTQTLAEVGSILFIEGAHWVLTKLVFDVFKCKGSLLNKMLGHIEFETPVSVLKLVYGQGLIFFGVFFCPFLPAIGFLRNILIFYLRIIAVFVFDKPPVAFFRVASTRTFYMAILLITVFISSIPIGFAVAEMTPSQTCGPFRGLDNMYRIIVFEIDSWPQILQTILDYLQTAPVVIPTMTILCIIIYYYASLGAALREVNKDLLLQLRVEQNETRKIIAQNAMVGEPSSTTLDARSIGSMRFSGAGIMQFPVQLGKNRTSTQSISCWPLSRPVEKGPTPRATNQRVQTSQSARKYVVTKEEREDSVTERKVAQFKKKEKEKASPNMASKKVVKDDHSMGNQTYPEEKGHRSSPKMTKKVVKDDYDSENQTYLEDRSSPKMTKKVVKDDYDSGNQTYPEEKGHRSSPNMASKKVVTDNYDSQSDQTSSLPANRSISNTSVVADPEHKTEHIRRSSSDHGNAFRGHDELSNLLCPIRATSTSNLRPNYPTRPDSHETSNKPKYLSPRRNPPM